MAADTADLSSGSASRPAAAGAARAVAAVRTLRAALRIGVRRTGGDGVDTSRADTPATPDPTIATVTPQPGR